MQKFKFNLRDGLSQEWNFIFKVKLGTILFLALSLITLGAIGHAYFIKKTLTPRQKYISNVVSDFNVRRHFDGHAYGTFWDNCGVTLTADHVLAELVDEGETFVGDRVNRSFGVIDAAHFGKWKCDPPRKPVVGEKISVIGYPSGSVHPALRYGEIYLKRGESGSDGYDMPTWIAVFYDDEPVVGGMSGSLVISEDGTPLGVLVTQNSPTYFHKFKAEKHGSDFAALHDYWNYVLNVERE
jgi:hypothetical protein